MQNIKPELRTRYTEIELRPVFRANGDFLAVAKASTFATAASAGKHDIELAEEFILESKQKSSKPNA